MPFDAPFMLGPFSVDAAGRLAPRDQLALPAFVFRWRDRIVRARLGQNVPETGDLVLRVGLGRVPSTATTPTGAPRVQSFAALHWLPQRLPATWQMVLLPDHCVLLQARASVALPITAIGLLAELTAFLLALAPYLDLLEGVGVTPPGLGAAAGIAKTWPG